MTIVFSYKHCSRDLRAEREYENYFVMIENSDGYVRIFGIW